MLCLMRSAPSLQRLVLVGLDYGCRSYADDATGPGEDFWIAIQSLEVFASLRNVDIDIMIQEPDMEFMRFILARAQVLETLTISSPTETTRHHESALAELRKFHRTSTRAQIIYEDEQEEDETED
ncbi:uncharacterized protein M6B38_139385 [Iris pallida]|uniref:FBD domain-containing protein n=1 Tax=Iris pallida TaxID=29817 RepID=A0AAX6FCQ7_IRIPA|nr:uncharacterized protein M6B38_139385 [Iris pallida]